MKRILCVFLALFLFAGCAGKTRTPKTCRNTLQTFPVPEASGEVVYADALATVDASHLDQGYVMIRYTGTAEKVKLQITAPDGTVYQYPLVGQEYETFPLSGGAGDYRVDVLEHAYEQMYALAFSQELHAVPENEFLPFLYPNQYVWVTPDSPTAELARELSAKSETDLQFVGQVYHYVVSHIVYDEEKAAKISRRLIEDYIPSADRTVQEGTGICFDYACLMSAMLRSQGIPTKLEVGYSGTVNHAWISVYLEETGWIDKVIKFDGKQWSLMDPTLAANNDASAVRDYVGDGSNYTVKYSY